jgi:ABC-type uncharacterized transport system, periplasmic component
MLDLHYVNGKHFLMVERLANGKNERLPGLAEELVNLKVDLILASTTNAAAAARDATSSIPIVFFDVSDPVRAGFVESLGRPGRNMTGVSNFSGDLNAKRLELLKQMVPGLRRVAALMNPTNPYMSLGQIERVQRPAEQLGLLPQGHVQSICRLASIIVRSYKYRLSVERRMNGCVTIGKFAALDH